VARITQKEIARRLNLSQSLVAGVLNNRPGVWVSPENRERILRLARELNYRPNTAARALRRGRTEVVACVFVGPAGYSAIVETLADVVAEKDYDLLVKVVLNEEQAALHIAKLMAPGTCDAVILWGLERDIEKPAAQFAEIGIPFVVKGRFEEAHPQWYQADFDHEAMMRHALEFLKAKGHRRIAYLGYDDGLVYSQKLFKGYVQAFYDLFGEEPPQTFLGFIVGQGLPEEHEAAMLMERWLALPEQERPTAAVSAAGRGTWYGVEMALARHSMRLGFQPGEFAMAGQGGTEMPLLFGEGYAYHDVDFITLARAMGQKLLLPLLEGQKPERHILRLLPQLRPMETLRFPVAVASQLSAELSPSTN